MTEPILEVKNISKSFDMTQALDDVGFMPPIKGRYCSMENP